MIAAEEPQPVGKRLRVDLVGADNGGEAAVTWATFCGWVA
jgi:hypothetical protein